LKVFAAVRAQEAIASMTGEQGFALHPLAAQDITELWEYFSADNLLAARRVREEIYSAIPRRGSLPGQGHRRPGSHFTAFALHSGT
jgi:plasmid stabilization system protein ParE